MGSSQNETIIAQGVKVEGEFTSQGDVVIDGEVIGTVKTASSLRVGESARIQANVTAQSAVIAGEVIGNIQAFERLELLESSKVQGDVETQLISIAPGAVVNGRLTMTGVEDKSRG